MIGAASRRRAWGLCAAAVSAMALGALLWLGSRAVAVDLGTERDLHGIEYVGSETCRRCHENHWASWHRTFHRTMTREANEGSVLGDFGGASFTYLGVTARMTRGADGTYRVTFTEPDAPVRTVEVVRTVGSHRYQQYLSRSGDEYHRLPVAWHVEEGRWFHMNGAFLTPDPREPPAGGAVARADYDRHVVRWNDNCIFCHNVAPNPGLLGDGSFDSTVAELGVACEACHGPGAAHARGNRNPLRRYALHLGEAPDPSIVNPARLPPALSADICGRCHGQRKAAPIAPFLQQGDPFVPGDDLALYSEPLWRDSTLDGEEFFGARFWDDGTPRLTAYEYQGLLLSACAQRGELTCTTCHGMHEGDPRGQIRPDMAGDVMCTGCHRVLEPDHSRHDERSPGARCVGCHMPRLVYGLVAVHRSHRIEVPEPAQNAHDERPDACTTCHVNQTRQWAIEARARLWPAPAETRPLDGFQPSGVERTAGPLSHALETLFGGDPIERALSADALGRSAVPRSKETRAVELGALLATLRDDRYPAVRRIAWQAAERTTGQWESERVVPWSSYSPTATRAERARAVTVLVDTLPSSWVTAPPPSIVQALRRQASEQAIEIGE